MKTLSISQLARQFGLSRSTLLYYDRIGLLPPADRTESGYRVYGAKDRRRLERICSLREAGLTLADIKACLATRGKPSASVLKRRLRETADEISGLKQQQRLLARMMKRAAARNADGSVDKKLWVEMLRAAGMSNEAMGRWHAEFERRAPQAHHDFLLSLGIPEAEVRRIRDWSAMPTGGRDEPA